MRLLFIFCLKESDPNRERRVSTSARLQTPLLYVSLCMRVALSRFLSANILLRVWKQEMREGALNRWWFLKNASMISKKVGEKHWVLSQVLNRGRGDPKILEQELIPTCPEILGLNPQVCPKGLIPKKTKP